MNHPAFPHLTLLTLAPFATALVVLTLPAKSPRLGRSVTLASSVFTLLLAICCVARFDPSSAGMQFVERHPWIPILGVEYHLGLDGLSLVMVLLTGLIVPLALLTASRSEDRANLFHALVLFLQAGLFGTFTALNFFHWFLFWELSLIPAFFLIRLWGGAGRSAAAMQFFVYTMVGSVTLLLAFLALYLATSTFDFLRLAELARNGALDTALTKQFADAGLDATFWIPAVFLGAFLGFAVKVPLMPFHTWLPAAYTEAPSSVTMLLTGLMSKMGVYGFLRILLPIFPAQLAALRTPLLVLAVATIVLAAAAAFAQRDLKRILAYSSINHLGYCLLAVFAVTGPIDPGQTREQVAALNGVILQMFNHGLTAATLFGLVAFFETRTGGRREITAFGGLRRAAPVFTGLMGIALFSSLGLPGLNGFVGEFLIFKGVFPLATCSATVSTLGLLITAVFILTILQRVFHGPLAERWSTFPDLDLRERLILAPAIALMFVLGVWPQALVGWFNTTVLQMVEQHLGL